MKYDNPIDCAIEMAAKAHVTQFRKGTDIPYITHPFGVAMLLAQAGRPEEEIIAGILHDTIEDTSITVTELIETFGEKVAAIVQGCSEPDKALPWEDRKRHTIEYLKIAPMNVLMVACADKLHNIRAMASDYKYMGDELWNRFRRGKKEQAWYYQALANSIGSRFSEEDTPQLAQEFLNEVHKLFDLE